MAASSSKSGTGLPLVLLCLFLAVLSLAHVTMVCGRKTPVQLATPDDKKQTDCLDSAEGTVMIPGIGRTVIGSAELPSIGGLDNSGPAAANGQYIPGADDTFVPNPGFEVPNPFRGSVP